MATFSPFTISISISKSIIFIILASLFLANPITATFHGSNDEEYIKTVNPEVLGLKKEKLTHFTVYWQDLLSGPKPTNVALITPSPTVSKTGFGSTRMIDNALTVKPDVKSKIVGRAQGFYSMATHEGEIGLLMVMNFIFVEGKYKGSTISVLGRNPVFSKVREMPVIGGSGLFRFARGYVEARTKMYNLTSGDATVEYNCYVLHY